MTKSIILKITMEDYLKLQEISKKEKTKVNNVATAIISNFINPIIDTPVKIDKQKKALGLDD